MPNLENKIDENDLAYFIKLYGFPLASQPCPIQKNGKINPHESRFLCKDGKTFVSIYHVKPVYYQTLARTWRPLSEVAHGFGNRWITLKENWHEKMHPHYLEWLENRMKIINGKIFVSNPYLKELQSFQIKDWLPKVRANLTLTAFPAAGANSPVDGRVAADYAAGTNKTWTQIQGDAGNASSATITGDSVGQISMDSGTDGFRILVRSIFLFDTSSLGSGATISATTLSLYDIGKADTGTAINPTYNIFTSAPASNSALVNADFTTLGTVAQATAITHANWTANAYNDFTLNATGRGNVSLTGISKFGSREATYDAPNSAPTWSSNSNHYAQCSYADTAGTSQDPKLVVTYTVSGRAASLMSIGMGN